MISAKLAALCLCPALVATPAVIATHPKARHAVAHLLHRAADRLEMPHQTSPTQFASAPCLPGAIAGGLSSGIAAPVSSFAAGSALGISIVPTPVAAMGGSDAPGLTAFNPGSGGGGVAGGGGGFGGFGVGSGGGGGGGSSPGITPTPVAGVTEPHSWALLITGFGATGIMLRGRRAAAQLN